MGSEGKPPRRVGGSNRAAVRVHGDVEGKRSSAFASVQALVREIPRGKVMTYGQIATLIENRLSPRAVGWALHGCPKDVPWQRVVNASGRCSTDRLPDFPMGIQRALLEAEGVRFEPTDAIDLERYRWTVPAGKARARPQLPKTLDRGYGSGASVRDRQ